MESRNLGLRAMTHTVALASLMLATGGCFLFSTEVDEEDPETMASGTDGTDAEPPPADDGDTEGDTEDDPAAPSCPSMSTPTIGDNEVASLRHNWGAFQCLFGCGAERPLAAHALSELVVMNADELGDFVVASGDPEVASFSSEGGSLVEVETGRAGPVQLELRDPDSGLVLESFALEVADVAEVDASQGWNERLTVAVGGAVRLPVEVRDADGCHLVGVGAVDYEIGDGFDEYSLSLYDLFSDLLVELLFGGSLEETFELQAHELGEGTVSISAPSGAMFALPVASVGPSAVASLEAPDTIELGVGSTVIFGVDAFREDGERVYGPDCEWSVEPAQGSLSDLRHEVAFRADTAGSYEVTCTVGEASSTTVVAVGA